MDNSLFVTENFSEKHIKQVSEIEKQTFGEPWSVDALSLLCKEEYPSFAVCVRSSGDVAGYIGTLRAADELQMINLAVRQEYRGLGIGKKLLSELDRYAGDHALSLISLEVRISNLSAISLYESCGYKKEGIRKGFYRFPAEDAAVMIKKFEL